MPTSEGVGVSGISVGVRGTGVFVGTGVGVAVGGTGVGVGGTAVAVGGTGVGVGGTGVAVGGTGVGVGWDVAHAVMSSMANVKPITSGNALLRFIMTSSCIVVCFGNRLQFACAG